ncbi:DMT family transporter [Nocardioides marmoribigeumensis]|jgi:small multidrug resistance pump|uniref:Small multidrug resistance pump n=1 Tax=Nocardioides marmoribigeumensis TaxID=433649 RepID=A0ABU2BXU3_9ACTN|nr:SMR family transporter [Nocardioides marmoribigeumensis]MDR7363229.1 small multidrug resistance pump [Nocardioides marmoribigeumensis]
MGKWLLLAAAIGSEVAGTLSLKAALTQRGWYAVVVVGYVASFFLLNATLAQGMPLAIAYAIWAGFGVAITAVLSSVLFDERVSAVMWAGMALIVLGVVVVELGAGHDPT